MSILYEHWRPDKNVCFYVGISRHDDGRRAHDLSPRNHRHAQVLKELKDNNLSVNVVIQASEIPDDWAVEIEKNQIAYWKDLVGEDLTNIHPGGGGLLTEWDDDLRVRQSEILKEYAKSPEGIVWRKEISSALESFYATEEGKKSRQQQKISRDAFYASPEGEVSKEIQRIKRKKFLESPEGKIYKEEIGRHNKEFYKSERGQNIIKNNPILSSDGQKIFYQTSEGKKKAESHGKRMKARYSGADGDLERAKNSASSKEAWRNPEYRLKMMYRSWWNSNCRHRFYWGA